MCVFQCIWCIHARSNHSKCICSTWNGRKLENTHFVWKDRALVKHRSSAWPHSTGIPFLHTNMNRTIWRYLPTEFRIKSNKNSWLWSEIFLLFAWAPVYWIIPLWFSWLIWNDNNSMKTRAAHTHTKTNKRFLIPKSFCS